MINSLSLYLKMIAVSIRSQWQYKASFFMMAFGHALNILMEFFSIWVFFNRFHMFGSWAMADIAIFYGMAHMSFAINEGWTRGFDMFHNMVRTGDFDRLLLRPRSTVLQLMGKDFQIYRIGRFAQGLMVFVWAYISIGLGWNILHWLLFCCAILGGAALYGAIIVLQATSAFWTIEGIEVFNILTYGGTQLAQYPISEYKQPVRNFFMFVVPLCAINYLPASVLLGRNYVPQWLAWSSPLIGPVLLACSFFIWNIGVRHYKSTGS